MRILILSSLYILFFLQGCAFDVMRVEQTTAYIDDENTCRGSFVLDQDVNIVLAGGYYRKLKQGTRWNCVGRLKQGGVYKSRDQVLTIEASNVFEANLVISAGDLVGFYLPVEHAFSPLKERKKLVISKDTLLQTVKQ